jgi:hypothetical protein
VPHRDFISIPPKGAFVIVYDPDSEVGNHAVLPMLTLSGILRCPSSTVREERDQEVGTGSGQAV